MMRDGQRSYIPCIGYIRIESVEQVKLANLKDADAIPDGFETDDALREELNELYTGKIETGYKAFRVTFQVTEDTANKC